MNKESKNGIAGASNTPAPNTSHVAQNAVVDWVTASFYSEKNFSEIQQLFMLTEMEILQENGTKKKEEIIFKHKHGSRYEFADYTETYRYSYIEFMHDPKNNKWLLNLSGQGCREFERISLLNYELLFGMLIGQLNAVFSRIDIAIDDYKSIFKVNTIRKAVANGQAVTNIRKYGTRHEGYISDGSITMDNFYIGTLKSRYSINIYDKKLERESKGKEVTEKSWTRFEIRLKEEYATRFARIIATSTGNEIIGKYIAEFLNEHLKFLTKKSLAKEKNRSRAAEDFNNYAHWWKKFIGNVGKLSLSQKAPDKTVERTVSWFKNQIAPSLAVLNEVDPDGLSKFLYLLSVHGKERLNQSHEIMIEQAKNNALTLYEVLERLGLTFKD